MGFGFGNIKFPEKVENFLDGPGNVEENREKGYGRISFLADKPAVTIAVVIAVLMTLFFYLLPQLDIEFTKLFYLGNNDFLMVSSPIGYFFHKTLVKGMVFLLIGLGVAYIVGEFRKKATFTLTRRRLLYIGLCIAVSAGLITNVMLKNHWGRARPRAVVEFGGTQQFTPAAVISDQCTRNCSFVSGESSFGFSFVCFAFLALRRRRLWFIGTMLFGTAVGMMRVMMGAHFLSDSLLAGAYTILTLLVIERIMLNKQVPAEATQETSQT